jgi:hypothetical protein
MYVRRKGTLIDLGKLCGQVREQVLGVEDPDWYAPRFGIDGAIHCVRVPIAGSPLKAFRKAQQASAGQGFGDCPPEGGPYLVSALKSGTKRNGLKGMTASSRRKVLKRAQVLGAFPGSCSFVTPTLTNVQVALLDLVPDGMQIWQDRLRHSLVRRLARHTDKPLLVLRVEMHPKRSREQGMPIPHVHGVMRTKSHRWMRGWWIEKDDWDACLQEATAAVLRRGFELLGGAPVRHRLLGDKELLWDDFEHLAMSPGRVDFQLAKDPAAYISKYIAKNEDGLGGADAEAHPNLIPHQWLSTSKPLQQIVDCCEVQLPPELAEWLWRNGFRLAAMGLGTYREWHPPGCDKHQITSFYVKSPELFAQLWELFLLETGYGRWLEPGAPPLSGLFAGMPLVELFPSDLLFDPDSSFRHVRG